jgi:hypothetical protein
MMLSSDFFCFVNNFNHSHIVKWNMILLAYMVISVIEEQDLVGSVAGESFFFQHLHIVQSMLVVFKVKVLPFQVFYCMLISSYYVQTSKFMSLHDSVSWTYNCIWYKVPIGPGGC